MQRGRPRQDVAQREPNGRAQRDADRGTTELRDRREALVGADNTGDKRAGYPLGILFLRGAVKAADHQAGLLYAALHAVVWGNSTPKSHLANLVAGLTGTPSLIDDADREKRLISAADRLGKANAAVLALGTRRPYDILQNIVVYERELRFMDSARARTPAAWQADQRDLDALQEATDALAKEWGLGHYAAKRAAD